MGNNRVDMQTTSQKNHEQKLLDQSVKKWLRFRDPDVRCRTVKPTGAITCFFESINDYPVMISECLGTIYCPTREGNVFLHSSQTISLLREICCPDASGLFPKETFALVDYPAAFEKPDSESLSGDDTNVQEYELDEAAWPMSLLDWLDMSDKAVDVCGGVRDETYGLFFKDLCRHPVIWDKVRGALLYPHEGKVLRGHSTPVFEVMNELVGLSQDVGRFYDAGNLMIRPYCVPNAAKS